MVELATSGAGFRRRKAQGRSCDEGKDDPPFDNPLKEPLPESYALDSSSVSSSSLRSLLGWNRFIHSGSSSVGSSSMEETIGRHVFWLSRWMILRALGLLYVVIFLSTEAEIPLLIGNRGLSPVATAVDSLRRDAASNGWLDAFIRSPSLLHLMPASWIEGPGFGLVIWCRIGLTLAACVAFGFCENAFVILGIWCVYNSVKEVGGFWYSFAWEPQLSETTLHIAILFRPLFRLRERQAPRRSSVTSTRLMPLSLHIGRCFLALLAFRIMLAAGLLKKRARDPCWRDYTCFKWHYENMPMPNPLTWFAHHLPLEVHAWIQYVSIDIVELICPYGFLFCFFEWVPYIRRAACYLRRTAALGSIALMIGIQCTGNYSFLNVLTCLPCLACLDDKLLVRLGWPKHWALPRLMESAPTGWLSFLLSPVRPLMVLSLSCSFFLLALPGLAWLWDPTSGLRLVHPVAMTLWKDYGRSLDLGNQYSSGRFAHVTRERVEPVIWALACRAGDESCHWMELDIPCKPGSLDRAPCFTSPYHRRLAWQFWFVGLGHDNSWLQVFCQKLLMGEEAALGALEAGHPFRPVSPPRAIRVRHYRYFFSDFQKWVNGTLRPFGKRLILEDGVASFANDEGEGLWWRRIFLQETIPPIMLR